MGVYGLLSHCLQHREQCVQYADLVEIARDKGGIELLVDFYSFEHLLLNNFWKSLASVGNNPYLRLLGGEYQSLDRYITKLITDLQALDIHLVMYTDGAKGSSKQGTEQKLDTWKYRHKGDLEKLEEIQAVLKGNRRIEELPETTNIRPVLLEVQIMETLKTCKCELVSLASGEADFVIARNLLNRPKAYAVVSNDSDFCIFHCCKFIPNDLFDLQKDLQLGKPHVLPEKPVRLMVGVISSNRVAELLDLPETSMLIELSIIAGNDFTSSYVRRLKSKVGIQGRAITEAAAWVQQYGKIENHPVIQKEMDHNRAFREAVHRTRQFYSLMSEEIQGSRGPLYDFISDSIQQNKFSAHIMSMHLNFYWHRMLLEDTSHGQPCAETALVEIRRFIYRMVLNRKDNTVVEYGRSPFEEFAHMPIPATRENRNLSQVNNIPKDKIFQNLRTFHFIMTHYEPQESVEWYKRYGWGVGFNFYVLRYFLVLNTGYNLHVSMEEFMPLTHMVFCKVDERFYQSLAIMPTLRCVTIGNWFQNVYRHAYLFLGKLLQLSHEFPKPSTMFCGSVWTAFYMVSMHESMLVSRFGVPHQAIGKIKQDMKHIFREKQHMLRYLVEGFYDLNTKF